MKDTIHMLKKQRIACILCMLLSCLQGALELIFPTALTNIIAYGIPACNASYIFRATLIAFAGAALALLCSAAARRICARTAARISFPLRKALFDPSQSNADFPSTLPYMDAAGFYIHVLHLLCCVPRLAICLAYMFYTSVSASIAVSLLTPALFCAQALLFRREAIARQIFEEAENTLSSFLLKLRLSHKALGSIQWRKSIDVHFQELEEIHEKHFVCAQFRKALAYSFIHSGNILLAICAAAIAALSCTTHGMSTANIPALLICIQFYSRALNEISIVYTKLKSLFAPATHREHTSSRSA